MNFSSYSVFQAARLFAPSEFPGHPSMTTPVGVSATSLFIASASVDNYTHTHRGMQAKCEKICDYEHFSTF
jgi:hypothetical protein